MRDDRRSPSFSALKVSFGVSIATVGMLMVVLLLTAAPAEATNYTSTAGGGLWSDPTKWSPTGVPGSAAGDTATILCCAAYTMDYSMPNQLAGFSNASTLTFAAGGHLRLGAGTNTNSGTINFIAGSMTITAATLTSQTGSTFNASNVTITGSSGGVLDCASCAMTLGSGMTLNAIALNTTGNLTFNGTTQMNMNAGATINVNTGGLFEIQNNATIFWAVSPQPAINVNAGGIMRKTTTAGTTNITGGVLLNNNGLVEAQVGTINVPVGTSSGVFKASAPASIDFNSAIHSVNGASVDGNNVRLNGGTINGAGGLTVLTGATMTWSSGTMSGSGVTTVVSGATLNITGSVTFQRDLDNFGLVNFTSSGGTMNMGAGAAFNNKPTGVFDAQNAVDTQIFWAVSPQVFFNNEGLFKKTTTGAGLTRFTGGVLFNNTGTVDAQLGTIQIAGGTSTGAFNATAPASVDFNTNTHTMNGATITGNGVRLNGGIINGTLLTIVNTAIMTWSSGTMSGATTDSTAIATGGTLKISGAVSLNGRGISNSGTVLHASNGGTLNLGVGTTITNNPGGVWEDQNTADTQIFWAISPQVQFNNAGTLTKTAGPAAKTRFTGGALLNNSGTVNPAVGIFEVAGGTSTGLFTAMTPAAVHFNNSTHTMNGASVGGNGVHLNGGIINGTNLIIPANATLNWSSGTMTGATTDATTIQPSGTLHVTGAVSQNGRRIENNGTVLFASNGGTWNLGVSATIHNDTAGVFDDQNTVDTQIFWAVSPQVQFVNDGLLKKSAGAGAKLRFTGGALLHNDGIVDAQVGIIDVAGGTSTGLFNAVSPAMVTFTTSTHTMNGATVGGNSVFLNGGSFNGPSFIVPTGAVFNWTSGTMGGTTTDATTIASGGTMIINGVVTLNARQIQNNGLVQFLSSGATFNFGGGAIFSNNASGVFDAQNATNTQLFWSTNPPVAFNNSGLVKKSTTGAGKTIFSGVLLNNSGTVDAQLGIIDVEAGTSTGTFTTSPGAEIQFTSNTHTLNTPAQITGSGVKLMGATLTGTGITVASGGTLTWVSGTMTGAGQTTTINAGGTLVIAGNGTLNARTLANNGSVLVTGGTTFNLGGGAIINNNAGGVWDDQNTINDQIFWATNPPVTFNNAGIFKKSASAGTQTTLNGVPFHNSGTVDAQVGTIRLGAGTSSGNFNTAAGAVIQFFTGTHTLTSTATLSGSGSVLLAGGTLASSSPITVSGGTLGGAGTINANVVNNSIVAPGASAGTLIVNGTYTQSPGAAMNIELGGGTPGSQYDRLDVNGAVTLAGTLNVTLINGFVPTGGQTFTPLLFNSRTGDFSVKNLPTFAGGGSFTSSYTATSLVLQAQVTSVDLSVTQSAPASVTQGQNVVITITVANSPANNATNVVVNESFSGATFVSVSSSAGTCSGTGPITCNIPTLALNSNATITLTLNANTPGTIVSTANVTSTEFDSNTANNSSTQNVTVNASADLAITKNPTGPVAAGQVVTYAIVVTNNGPSSAAAVTVNDTPGPGLTFLSNAGACTTPFPCSLGTIVSGGSPTIFASFAVAPNATSVTNSASVTSTTGDPNAANNTATTTSAVAQSADLTIAKDGPTSARPEATITYTIRVGNNGPSDANGVVVSDPTPARLTFVSNSGDCTTPFPCNLGTIPTGAQKIITARYEVTPGGNASITNTASVTSTTPDPFAFNNSDTARTSVNACSTVAPSALVPADQATVPPSGALRWEHPTATRFNVYLGPVGQGCAATTPFATVTTRAADYRDLTEGAEYEWRVETAVSGCPRVSSSCQRFTVARSCTAAAPTLTAPANNSVQRSPVTLSWTPSGVAGTEYTIVSGAGTGLVFPLGTTQATSFVANFPDGNVTWSVTTNAPGCPPLRSANGIFTVCNTPSAPVASAIALAVSGQSYTVSWSGQQGSTFELQQADNAAFMNAETITTSNTSASFSFTTTTNAVVRFYRVRQRTPCAQAFGPYSIPVRTVVVPLPRNQRNQNVNVAAGSREIVIQTVFIPGEPGGGFITFSARGDKPWMSVRPESGILPPDGVTLEVLVDPANLPNGTFTGTVIVTLNTPDASTRVQTHGTTTRSVPVSVSLVTPVTPGSSSTPPESALIIPSVGHLDAFESQWQSDVRVTNPTQDRLRYQLTFTPAGADPVTGVQQTIIDVEPGATTALDDIVRNWYGYGTVGDSANGILQVQPLDVPSDAGPRVSIVSSRTYNVSDNGTLGQYIPGIPFSNFIGKAAPDALARILSLQQIAQTDAYRTNVGLVEASGKPADITVSVFNPAGVRLASVPFSLAGSEQRQLNAFLSTLGINDLADGRIEVQVTGGDGRVTAYASVIDNGTNDPLLVSGVPLRVSSASRYVLPGVANLDTGTASWRTDMRVFNSGANEQPVTLTFYPQDNSAPRTAELRVASGEVETLDDVLRSVFGATNTGGAVHVVTAADTDLVVSGRTYNRTEEGTFGQFVPAVTLAEAVGLGEKSLEIPQVEDSPRYRTNVGFAEVSGKDVEIEISVTLPDSRLTPKTTMTIPASSFRQLPVISSLGLGNAYNARISVRVIGGEGRVTAYGSVIDMTTQDPTFVPAQ